ERVVPATIAVEVSGDHFTPPPAVAICVPPVRDRREVTATVPECHEEIDTMSIHASASGADVHVSVAVEAPRDDVHAAPTKAARVTSVGDRGEPVAFGLRSKEI